MSLYIFGNILYDMYIHYLRGEIMNQETIFGNRLKQLIDEKEMSQLELAQAFNTTGATISRYVKGERLPKMKNIQELAKYFDVTTDYLLGTSDFRNNQDIAKKLIEKLKKSELISENPTDKEIEKIIIAVKKYDDIKKMINL